MYAGVYPSPWIQVLFRLSAALSIFGSSWILTSVIRDRKNRNTCYHRLLFGLSVFDLLSSIGFFAGTWAQSKSPWLGDDNPTIAIIGNAATCDASGFVIYMGSLAIPWYNAALNVHYYLAVCQGWKEQKMKKQYERYVHICIIPVAIIIATIPLFLQLYNPYHFYCFIAGRVYESAHKIFLFLYVVSVIVCSAIINLSVLSVTCYVRKTSNKSQSYSFTTQGVETPGVESRRLRRRRKLTAEVKIMAFLYSVPFMITWLIPVLWITCVFITLDTSFHIVPVGEHVAHNIANIYIAIFVPLQGFFNWLVYVRPRLKKVIARIRNKGSLLMLKTVETISSYYMLCFRGCKEAEEDMDDDFYGGSQVERLPEEICYHESREDDDDSIDSCSLPYVMDEANDEGGGSSEGSCCKKSESVSSKSAEMLPAEIELSPLTPEVQPHFKVKIKDCSSEKEIDKSEE